MTDPTTDSSIDSPVDDPIGGDQPSQGGGGRIRTVHPSHSTALLCAYQSLIYTYKVLNAHTNIYPHDNVHKIMEGKRALDIPMRALQCIQIPFQKQIRPHATNAPMERKHLIPLRALILYLNPSLGTYVCPSLMRRIRYSFSVNFRTERK
jgi:hypothetical protein